jgi:hypothetical protein
MTPEDTAVFTDQDVLDIVNEELDVEVLEKLLTLHEEHLTVHIDIPKNSQDVYDIPYRSIGNKLRDVSIVSGNYVYELSQISIGELPDYTYNVDSSSYLDKFYVESNQIKLIKPTRTFDSIRLFFYIRPSVLTKLEKAGIISSIVVDEDNDCVTLALSQVGKEFSINELFDIVGKQTPNKIKTWDQNALELTNTGTSGTIKFSLSALGDSIDDIKVGDYVTLAEETPVPNIPTEMHPVLAQAGAIHILESLGDTEALTNAQRRMEKMTQSIQTLIDDRVELAPKKIKPRHGTLNQSLGSNRRRRGWY